MDKLKNLLGQIKKVEQQKQPTNEESTPKEKNKERISWTWSGTQSLTSKAWSYAPFISSPTTKQEESEKVGEIKNDN